MYKKTKFISSVLLLFILVSVAVASEITVKDIISKLKHNSDSINDLRFDITTRVKGEPGYQISRYFYKKKNKHKIVTLSHPKMTVVIDGLKQYIKSEDSTDVITNYINSDYQGIGYGVIDLKKYLKGFNISISRDKSKIENNIYVLKCARKNKEDSNSVDMYVNYNKGTIEKYDVFDNAGKKYIETEIKYKLFKDIWLITKINTKYFTVLEEKEIEVEFSDIRLNSGISDSEFKLK